MASAILSSAIVPEHSETLADSGPVMECSPHQRQGHDASVAIVVSFPEISWDSELEIAGSVHEWVSVNWLEDSISELFRWSDCIDGLDHTGTIVSVSPKEFVSLAWEITLDKDITAVVVQLIRLSASGEHPFVWSKYHLPDCNRC